METCEITLIHKELADEAQESLPDDSVILGMAVFFQGIRRSDPGEDTHCTEEKGALRM